MSHFCSTNEFNTSVFQERRLVKMKKDGNSWTEGHIKKIPDTKTTEVEKVKAADSEIETTEVKAADNEIEATKMKAADNEMETIEMKTVNLIETACHQNTKIRTIKVQGKNTKDQGIEAVADLLRRGDNI